MRSRLLSVSLVMLFAVPGAARSQVAWDSPLLVPPRAAPGAGVFLIEPAGGDLGVLATLRSSVWSNRLQFRLGLAGRGRGGGAALLGGADISGMLVRASDAFPIDVAWAAGVGLGVGDGGRLSAPLGLIVGRGFESEGVAFIPYASPRVIVDAVFGGPGDGRLGLDVAVDIGLDIVVLPEWTIRFGGTLGDRDAVAIGAVF